LIFVLDSESAILFFKTAGFNRSPTLIVIQDPEKFVREGGRLYKQWAESRPDTATEVVEEGPYATSTIEGAEEAAWSAKPTRRRRSAKREGIKEGMDFEELKDIGLLCVGSLEPGEGLVVITEA
jgi:hypothetical protein